MSKQLLFCQVSVLFESSSDEHIKINRFQTHWMEDQVENGLISFSFVRFY